MWFCVTILVVLSMILLLKIVYNDYIFVKQLMLEYVMFVLSFLNFLDYILKQFTMVGSLREKQVQSHIRTQIFILGNPCEGENTTKLPQYRTQPK